MTLQRLEPKKLKLWIALLYLGVEFTSRGDFKAQCKERAQKSFGKITELIPVCKEVNFGKNQQASNNDFDACIT